MTVVVSADVTDVTGLPDSRAWRAWSPVYRSGSSGEVVNIRPQPVSVVGGRFRGEFEPGILVIENPEKERWTVEVPDTDIDLWALIASAVAFPPDTSQAAVAAAVTTFLDNNPIENVTTNNIVDAGAAGKSVVQAATQADGRAALGGSVFGGQVFGAANAAAGRAALGAEVAGATKDMDDITDATVVGRSVARAVDAAGARSAIGAAAAGTDLTLVAGQNITLTQAGSNLTVAAVHSPPQGVITSIDRASASDITVPTGTGTLRLSYFTARRSGNYGKIRVKTGDTAASATPTLVRFALFTVASNWTLTRVAVTANDTTLLAAANTAYEKALPSSYSVVGGTWYALGVLVVTAGTAPTLVGKIMPDATEAFLDPRLCGVINSQTDIQTSYAGGSISSTTGNPYIVLVP